MRKSFDSSPESHNVVLIDSRVIREAETFVAGCEACSPDYSQIPFDSVLDGLSGNDPVITDYILSEPAMCPGCRRTILENTLVKLAP